MRVQVERKIANAATAISGSAKTPSATTLSQSVCSAETRTPLRFVNGLKPHAAEPAISPAAPRTRIVATT